MTILVRRKRGRLENAINIRQSTTLIISTFRAPIYYRKNQSLIASSNTKLFGLGFNVTRQNLYRQPC
jgi:hypothetical protein